MLQYTNHNINSKGKGILLGTVLLKTLGFYRIFICKRLKNTL